MSAADSSTGVVAGRPLPDAAPPAEAVPGPAIGMRLRPHHVSVATVVVLIAVWALVARLQIVSPVFMPSPLAVARKFIKVAVDGSSNATLLQHTLASLERVFAALGLAILTAVPLGVLTGLNRTAQAIADPLIEFYRPVPPLAYLPLIVIWCGIGEPSKILLIWLAIFAPLTIATQQGVRRVKASRLRGAQALGATRWQLIRYVVVPSAAPDVLTGIRISLGVGWSVLVAAELIAATRGLGFMIQSAAQFLETDVVVMGIIVIALIAAAFEWGLRRLQKALVPWDGHA
jgi:taurine transport system permease protein